MPNNEPPDISAPPADVCQDEHEPSPLSVLNVNSPAPAATGDCPYIWDESLPQRLVNRMHAHAKYITGAAHVVEDIEQEVKWKLLNMPRHIWSAIPHKAAYVLQMTRNASRDWLRKELALDFKHRSFMNTQQHKLEGPVTDLSDPACAVGDLMRILEPFGIECAEAFVRVRFFGHPATTVATVMNIPVPRVRAYVNRIELHVMTLLEEKEPKRSPLTSRFINLFKRGV